MCLIIAMIKQMLLFYYGWCVSFSDMSYVITLLWVMCCVVWYVICYYFIMGDVLRFMICRILLFYYGWCVTFYDMSYATILLWVMCCVLWYIVCYYFITGDVLRFMICRMLLFYYGWCVAFYDMSYDATSVNVYMYVCILVNSRHLVSFL